MSHSQKVGEGRGLMASVIQKKLEQARQGFTGRLLDDRRPGAEASLAEKVGSGAATVTGLVARAAVGMAEVPRAFAEGVRNEVTALALDRLSQPNARGWQAIQAHPIAFEAGARVVNVGIDVLGEAAAASPAFARIASRFGFATEGTQADWDAKAGG